MQDLLIRILYDSPEISGKVCELGRAMPGYEEAAQAVEAVEKEAVAILGLAFYDRLYSALGTLFNYESRAYFAVGLGLREELIRSLEL